jgi:hypothetical protein
MFAPRRLEKACPFMSYRIALRLGIRYALHGQHLSAPATGVLRLNFRG